MTTSTIALSSAHSEGRVQIMSTHPNELLSLSELLKSENTLERYILESIETGQEANVEKFTAERQTQESITVRSEFLSELLSSKTHQILIGYQGIKIIGLNAPDCDLRIHFNTLSYPVEFIRCSLGSVVIQGVSTKACIKFKGCSFTTFKIRNLVSEDDVHLIKCKAKSIRFDNIRVYGDLVMRGTQSESIHFFGGKVVGEFSLKEVNSTEVYLASTNVEGVLQADKANINQFEIHGGSCGRIFQINDGQFNTIRLVCFKSKGSLKVSNSTISQRLRFESVEVFGDTIFDEMNIHNTNILGGHFGGLLAVMNSQVNKELSIQRSVVIGSLFLRRLKSNGDIDLSFTTIHNSLGLESLSFISSGNTFDMTGVEIKGDLRFYQDDDRFKPLPWGDQKLILRNCSTKGFQDHPDVWPTEIDFTGFMYLQISGKNRRSQDGFIPFADRKISWILQLLNRQSQFNPQPYWQLASVLGQIGYEQKSTAILYECAKRRRKNSPAFFARNFKRLHFWINGYGYYNMRVLYWCILLIISGMGILYTTGEATRLSLSSGFLYSIDMLIPVVEFSKRYYSEAYALQNYTAELYFFFHELMGYVFAFMVASGLSKLSRENQ
jgi:hypothetical protein